MLFLKHNVASYKYDYILSNYHTICPSIYLVYLALSGFCLPATPVFCDIETCRQRCGDRGELTCRTVSINQYAVAFQAVAFLDALPTCAWNALSWQQTHTATSTITAAAPSRPSFGKKDTRQTLGDTATSWFPVVSQMNRHHCGTLRHLWSHL
jgi:hypothetical protein